MLQQPCWLGLDTLAESSGTTIVYTKFALRQCMSDFAQLMVHIEPLAGLF